MRDDCGSGHSLAKFQLHKRLDEQLNSSVHRSREKPRNPKPSLTSSSLHRPHQRQQQQQPMSPRSKEELRLKVNARERQRMHDMNSALDALRMSMPYARGPSVKKLSKMNTLLLARNYILLLTKTTEDLRRMLAEAVSYGGSLASWPAKLDASVLLGTVQDAYDKQRRFTEELLLQQQQQQKDDEKVLQSWKQRSHNDKLLTSDGVRNFEVADATATSQWSRVVDDHKTVKRHRETPPSEATFPAEISKRSKLEKALEIPSEWNRDATNSWTQGAAQVLREKSRSVDEKVSKSGRVANKNSRSNGLNDEGDEDDDDDEDEDAKTGKSIKEEDDDDDDDGDEEVVVDSSFSLDDGEQSEVTGDQANKAADGDDDDEDDARRRHHHSRVQPLLLSSLLASSSSSSPPPQMPDEMVSSTTKRSAFQLVDQSRAGCVPPSERLPLQKLSTPRPPQRQDDLRKMMIQTHFPFFIPPSIPAYHHHHHHLLHPFLTHPPGGIHAPAARHHVVMTSLLENSHVLGACPCRLCLPKDPM